MYNPQLDTFLAVVEAGSFNKAAERLYISPPAVIKQINLLESSLGVRLFTRTHRGLVLTEAGRSLAQDARYVVQYCKDSVTRARNAAGREQEVLRIGTSPMTPAQVLVDLWPKIQEDCPGVKFQLVPYDNTPENAREILAHLGQNIDVVAGIFDETMLARLEAHVRISRLLEVAARPVPETRLKDGVKGRGIVAVARNEESFSFLYTEHLDLLRRYGEVVFFDPEQSVPLPAETSLLYLPGGYPEKHAGALGASAVTMESVRRYIDGGGRALAECGGMIYLSQGVCLDGQPDFLPLVGVLPFSISNRKEHRKLSLGYRRFDYNGQTLRGHEFHYTQYIERAGERLLPSVARVYNARGQEVATPVFRYRNLLASYTHLYWGETDLDRLFADKV